MTWQARLANWLLLGMIVWKIYDIYVSSPNIFYELDLPRNVPNFRFRNAIRERLSNHYGHYLVTMEDVTNIVNKRNDSQGLRLLELWEKLRHDEQRGYYCTFGERAFTQCGDNCQSLVDYVFYLVPSIAWEYFIVAIVVGLATSSLPLPQRRRQIRARFYVGWALLIGVAVEWIAFSVADKDKNDPLGVWPIPFLHDDLSATRCWLLLAILCGTWWDARPRPLVISDPSALVSLMNGELEMILHRTQAIQLVRTAIAEDDTLRSRYLTHYRTSAADKSAVETDLDYLSGKDRLRARIETDRIIEEASQLAAAVVTAGSREYQANEAESAEIRKSN
ncbi:hypothetical protein BDF19DRAFT_429561 [Syncephalis fuscata]|nr:hypothetical protein BDF19DRAFT_429561 [Syncephalis fuscata]